MGDIAIVHGFQGTLVIKRGYSHGGLIRREHQRTQIDEQIKSHRVSLGAVFVVSGWIEDD